MASIQSVKFTNVRLANSNKQGILPKDSAGYRQVVVGGLNLLNSCGEFYTAEGARNLFEKSSSFMRRVQAGALRGEVGHPKFAKGMTTDDYIARIMNIDDENVCCHFSDVWLDANSVKQKDGRPVIAIMANVIPSGSKADELERAFNNPKESVAFSVRGLTNDYYDRGQTVRELRQVVTFDKVNEPGLHIATKYSSPTLESLDEYSVSKNEFMKSINSKSVASLATESSIALGNDIVNAFGWDLPKGVTPAYSNW